MGQQDRTKDERSSPDEPRAAPPILRYFAWGHLPPHLAEISAPFADLAHLLIAAQGDGFMPREFTSEMNAHMTRILEKLGPEPADPAASDEWGSVKWKFHNLWAAWENYEGFAYCLRLLLEAKDCAVRTRVLPPMEGCDG